MCVCAFCVLYKTRVRDIPHSRSTQHIHVQGESSLPRVFAKRLVCTSRAVIPGQRDAIMQRTGHLPSLLSVPRSVPRRSPPPASSSPSASSIVSLTLKPLKRSHSRPCSLHRAVGSNHVRNASPRNAYIVAPRRSLISQPRSPLSPGCRGRSLGFSSRLRESWSRYGSWDSLGAQFAKFNENSFRSRDSRIVR